MFSVVLILGSYMAFTFSNVFVFITSVEEQELKYEFRASH